MKGRLKISTLFFYGLAALMGVMVIVTFVSGISWINKPFAGFLVYKTKMVGSIWMQDWSGADAGLFSWSRFRNPWPCGWSLGTSLDVLAAPGFFQGLIVADARGTIRVRDQVSSHDIGPRRKRGSGARRSPKTD